VYALSDFQDIKRLFMSGYTAEIIAHQGVLEKGGNFIQKPFILNDLASKLKNMINPTTKLPKVN